MKYSGGFFIICFTTGGILFMQDNLEKFLNLVTQKSALQNKYIKKYLPNLTAQEIEDLKQLIGFYEFLGYSIEDIAEYYLFFVERIIMEETKYFVEHGTYRYSTFKEVSSDVYFNDLFMTKYMIGLGVSTYLWSHHLNGLRFFINFISSVKGENYLEIGPGHGEYFTKALKYSNLKFFHAVHLSESSVKLTKQYVDYCKLGGGGGQVCIENKNFFEFTPSVKYDVIVMGEVLEHVEEPLKFLRQIAKCSTEKTKSYVTTVVDAPTPDHIYHFRSPEEIFNMAESAGFKILEYKLFTPNNKPIEKVKKLHEAIWVGMILSL